MLRYLALALMLQSSLAFGHGAPVIWNGTTAKWLPSGLKSAGICHFDANGVQTSSAIVNADVDAAAAIVDTKLATISTAGKVSNSATTAASANTASAIVARDGSGNFSAGTISAALTGNASTASALAANGTNCSGVQAAQGVDASGNAEGCFTPAGSGDVVGPGSATDNALARYDSTTGKLIQNSNAILDDDGLLTLTNSTTANGTLVLNSEGVGNTVQQTRAETSANGPNYTMRKSRGTIGTPTTAVTGDQIGTLNWHLHDGTAYRTMAQIRVFNDTVTGTDDMSSYMWFGTRNDGAAASSTERMRIHKAGQVTLGNNLTPDSGALLDVNGAVSSRPKGTSSGDTGQICMRELAANGTNRTCIRAADSTGDINFTLPSTACTGTWISTAGVWSCSTTTGATTSTEWASYTPTITGMGTVGSVAFRWRRVGDTLEVKGYFSSGTVSAALFSITFPAAASAGIDTNKTIINTTTGGGELEMVGHHIQQSTGKLFVLVQAVNTSTTLVYGAKDTTVADYTVPANADTLYSSVTGHTVYFKVPISGWTNSN